MMEIKIVEGGPALIKTKEEVLINGKHVKSEDDTKLISICRCGKSSKQPHCDGSHAVKSKTA